jgi:DNA polymerase III sliding clamp (beta) subunit (PCNA family)
MDRAGGIQITFDVMDAHIQATDLDLTFYQKVPCETINPTTIRVATVVAQFVGTLPMDRDQIVRFLREDKSIIVQYGKTGTKAKVPQITGEYPRIPWHDVSTMTPATEMASKAAAVAWAVEDRSHGVLSAIRIDGKHLEALSSKQCARIECEVGVDEPINAVMKALAPLLKQASDLRVKAEAGHIILALDENTQVTSTTVLGAWPDLTARLAKYESTEFFTIQRTRLLDALNRMLGFVRNDRQPMITFIVKPDRIDIALIGSINGEIQDSCALIERTGDDPHAEVTFVFNPMWMRDAIESFPGSKVDVAFSSPTKPLKLMEPSTSYEAFIIGIDPSQAPI